MAELAAGCAHVRQRSRDGGVEQGEWPSGPAGRNGAHRVGGVGRARRSPGGHHGLGDRIVSGAVRPAVVVFDVVETLASLDAVESALVAEGLPDGFLKLWFSRLLRDGFALTAAGAAAGFREVAASSLRAVLAADPALPGLADDRVDRVLGAFGELTPQPDAVEAVRAARAAGMRVFVLSNGAVDSTRGFLERAGLTGDVDQVLSVDEAGAWKPAAAPYQLAVRRAGVPAARVALIAVHSWDVAGARRAGLATGWTPRLEKEPTAAFGRADVVGDDLVEVVRRFAALPAEPDVELLVVPDCPHHRATFDLVTTVLRDLQLGSVQIRTRVVHSWDDAVAADFAGSPTVRVNGSDLEPDKRPPSLACRMYRTSRGLEGVPDHDLVQRAILVGMGHRPATDHA